LGFRVKFCFRVRPFENQQSDVLVQHLQLDEQKHGVSWVWLNLIIFIFSTASGHTRQIRQVVNSCSVVSVPAHLIKEPISFVVSSLQSTPKVRLPAGLYLNSAYGLAIFKALPSYEANKILHPEFFVEVERYFSEYVTFSIAF
jgi:hypothetical protein